MKFDEALNNLFSGKKITNTDWKKDDFTKYLECVDNKIYLVVNEETKLEKFTLSNKILNMDTWEIYKGDLLDKEERRYLKEVCRPFRKRILYVYKSSPSNSDYSNIDIVLKSLIKNDDYNDLCSLPKFKNGTMYNNLDNERYTLDELGIRYEKSSKR